MPRTLFFLAALASLAVSGAVSAQTASLREAYQPYFLIGAAVNTGNYADENSEDARLIKTHFKVLTPENILKWEALQPHPGQFEFRAADRLVAFAGQNQSHVVGHTLVWHGQTPPWVFAGENGEPPDRDLLLARMRDHINTVLGRYQGRVLGWDVVNEALNEDGTLRDTPWRRAIGDDYIEKAFEYARAADPAAELYYNDYRLEAPAKRAGAVSLVKRLQAAGLRIDAVGIQGHVGLTQPSIAEQEDAIRDFHRLGVRVMITEMDVDVLPGTKGWGDADIRRREAADPAFNPYAQGLPAPMQDALAARYADFFRMYLRNHDKITRVTFWGLNDGDSWLNGFPIPGRTNHPLLFDRQNRAKPAFQAVLDAAQTRDRSDP